MVALLLRVSSCSRLWLNMEIDRFHQIIHMAINCDSFQVNLLFHMEKQEKKMLETVLQGTITKAER